MVTDSSNINSEILTFNCLIPEFFSQAENCENGEAEVGLAWAVKVLDASKDGEVVKFTIQTNVVRRFRKQLIIKQYALMS